LTHGEIRITYKKGPREYYAVRGKRRCRKVYGLFFTVDRSYRKDAAERYTAFNN